MSPADDRPDRPRPVTMPGGTVLLVLDHVNAYETAVLDGIRSVLSAARWPSVVYAHDSFGHRLRPAVVRLLGSGNVRGIITTVLSDPQSQADLQRAVSAGGLPTVEIGAPAASGWSVEVDNASGMRAIMEHLLDQVGDTRIALVRGLNHHRDATEREAVVRAQLAARGLALAPDFVIEGRFDRDAGYASTAKLLRAGLIPDAFVALNDRSAVGVMDALADAGLRVPADVRVTGFDDEAIAADCTPGLTTVNQDLFGQGALAAEMLLQQLAGGAGLGHRTHPAVLVVRGSTAANVPAAGEALSQVEPSPSPPQAAWAMQRALAINRAFMTCRTVPDLIDHLGANMSRLGLNRCFIVLHRDDPQHPTSPAALVLSHSGDTTETVANGTPLEADEVLPRSLGHELLRGSLVLQPLTVDGTDLGYVLFDQSIPDSFAGELLRMDLSRAIDAVQRRQRQTQLLESMVARRTRDLRSEVALRSQAERELRQANEDLLRLTKIDGLTGIANRAEFDHYLNVQWEKHQTDRSPFSMLLIDVDQFKQHNDTYGHLSGDASLRVLARCLHKATWSPRDLAARYGGDEFAALLPHTTAAGAATVANRLRQALRAHHDIHAATAPVPFTVSIGEATVVPDASITSEWLVTLADKALYEAKVAGRDRSVAGASPWQPAARPDRHLDASRP